MRHLAFTLGALAALASTAFADVGKEDLKKLAQAGVSDDLILSYARAKGPVARLSADDVVELKRAGMGDSLLATLVAMSGASKPAEPAPSDSTSASIATARAKLLSDPSVIYDGRYYYPRSYFTSEYSAYCSPSLAVGVATYYPGWVGNACRPVTWSAGRSYGRGWVTVRAGFGACGSGVPRTCQR
jgi:hypothetical protein